MKFELAKHSDEKNLRQLLWDTPMRGVVDLVFAREPNYNALRLTQGKFVQTIIIKKNNETVGLATRAIRTSKINGRIKQTGYLADFRLHPTVRQGYALAKGQKFLRALHADGKATVYTALIVDDNKAALSTLASNRANLPLCTDLGRILTPLLIVERNKSTKYQELERGNKKNLPEIVEALNKNTLQFAPVYDISDFDGKRFPDFNIEDFFILRKKGRISAVAGFWNQSGFRQTVALQYQGILRVFRPFLNHILGLGLPPTGEALKSAYMSFLYTDNPRDYKLLIQSCLQEASRRGVTHLVTGMHEDDPRSVVLKKFHAIRFAGRMFAITFEGLPNLDDRTPYMEPAML